MATAAPPRGANPFDDSGVRAGTGGVRRDPGLHASLLDMLRDSVAAAPGAEALAEVGGRRMGWHPRRGCQPSVLSPTVHLTLVHGPDAALKRRISVASGPAGSVGACLPPRKGRMWVG
jgi:hypothetical protein